MTKELNAVVVNKMNVSPEAMILQVVPDNWELPDFIPGQFAVLGLPGSTPRCGGSDNIEEPEDPGKLIKRAYSTTSSSKVKEYLEFYITLCRSGQLTPRLFTLNIGDRIWMSKRLSGMFTLRDVPSKYDVALIATGTGLAPYVSMIRSELKDRLDRKYAIIHGAYHSWDLGFRGELITLEQVSANFTYLPVISHPQNEPIPWTGLTGFVQDIWHKRLIDRKWGRKPSPDDTHVFLCGNPAMIDSMKTIVENEGFLEHTKKSPGNVHIECY